MLRVLTLAVAVFWAFEVWAQDAARLGAASILNSKPNVLKIDSPYIKAETTAQSLGEQKDYGEAPLGLAWGVNVRDVKSHGVTLRAIDTKSFPNSYEATYLPKPINELPQVFLSFGDEDKLWRIVSYSKPAYDDDQASKGLYLYRKYYQLLVLKYDNAEEFFKPKMNTTEENVVDGNGRPSTQYAELPSVIGDKTFLKDLQSDEVSLYSTFDDGKIGVSMVLKVDESGKSYIVIEYRNSIIMQENYDETLKSL